MASKSVPTTRFRLVPKAGTRRFLQLLNLPPSARASVSAAGQTVTIQIRVPRSRGCYPFEGHCIGDMFFRKINLPKVRGVRGPSR